MSGAATVLSALAMIRPGVEELYRDLHAHPELSHEERRTAGLVAARLGELGFEVHEGVGGTGVVGLLRNGDGPSVLLRADMDALPVREETGLPYASTATAADGTPVMHACGHDVHVACLLGAAELMSRARDGWSGTLVALFQPAEEAADGARGMVEDGLASIVGPVDVAMAQHVLAFPAGTVGTRSGPVLSAADSLRITVHGRGAHGSMPQAAVDPVVLAAMIVVRLQTVVAREVAPGDTAVVTVGSIQAGTKSNVIPDRAVLQLNVRTYDQSVRETVIGAIERIVRAECAASGSPRVLSSSTSTATRSPITTPPSPTGSPRRSPPTSGTERASCRSRARARTSATSRMLSVRPTPIGASAGSTRRPTGRRPRRAGSLRTSRSTMRPTSPRSSSRPSTLASRRW